VLPFAIPGGREPAVSAQPLYKPLPPVTEIDVEYAEPASPLGSDVVVIARAAPTLMDRDLVATPTPLSVTCTVKL
jgi:hypothetical protein